MYDKRIIILLSSAVFGITECFGNVIAPTTRYGSFNAYYLYNRNNPRAPTQILSQSAGLPAANVFKSQTAIIVHGLQGSASSTFSTVVKDAFISSLDMNVIVVDWSTPASLGYASAEQAVPGVAKSLADFIQILVQNNRVSLDRLHLVGYDLGAHVVGYAGRSLTGRIARITGLAPPSTPYRLLSTDARYVEVIHTEDDNDDEDGSGNDSNGIITPFGHVDFIAKGSHLAWELFASSITHNQLIGYLCSTSLDVCNGYTLPVGNNDYVKYGSGIFRVNTKEAYPY